MQVTDLAPATTYEYRAVAINSQGASSWSPIGSATTLPAAPLAPATLKLTGCSSQSLQLSWRAPGSQGAPITGYTVNIACVPLQAATNGHASASSEPGASSADGG